MDSEILKWIEQAPKSLRLSGSKKSFYNGERQLKLFFEIIICPGLSPLLISL